LERIGIVARTPHRIKPYGGDKNVQEKEETREEEETRRGRMVG